MADLVVTDQKTANGIWKRQNPFVVNQPLYAAKRYISSAAVMNINTGMRLEMGEK